MVDECLPSQAEAMAASLLDTLHLPSPTNGNHSNGAGKLRHAVMVPYPVQGQINPMLHLAKTLAKEHNFIITFVNNEHNHKRMIHTENRSKSSSTNPDSHQSNIRFVWVDNGLPPDFDYNDHADLSLRAQFFKACGDMKYPLKDLVESLNQEKPPVTFILSGFLCYWAHSVAVELHIPSVFLWPQSAAVFSIFYHTPKLVSNGFFPYKKTDSGCSNDLVSYIPGVPPLHPAELPTFLHVDDISQPIFQIVKAQFDIVESYDAIIINSFEELEKDACEALRTELSSRVSFVGPLLPPAFIDDGSLLHEKNDCIKWLDNKQEQSVLYVSFGSMFNPSAEDLQGIALGIKASKHPFLWAIRPEASSQNVSEILPENFLEDTKDYGLIIPWAPQLQVLSHPSVAAFLTHCGWNSTLESLSQGVPMIPFPILVDQPTNCKFLVDIWKVGMSIKKRPDHDGKVESEEVERVVRIVLQGEEGKEMRRRAGKLKDAARRAVQAQGTSNAHMEKFIKAMTRDA